MADTSFDPRIKHDWDRDGYVILRGFFPPAETEAMGAHVKRYLRDVVPTLPAMDVFREVKEQSDTIKMLPRMQHHDAYFADLRDHPRLAPLARLLLEDDWNWQGASWFNKPARVGEATPPHQDGYYAHLEPCVALTFWIPTEPVDEANGCVRYVRGSHRRGMRPHGRTQTLGFSQGITDYGPADTANEVAAVVNPGDLIAHHTMTIHRADANTSGRGRPALGSVYYAARAKVDHAAIDAYQEKLQSELVQAGKI
jgi:phytanoyl-CoA hydroxylase